ncbi:hypothetical protein LB941_11865 [Ligilactobacillus sp. WILCCON 0076]|uniref:Uncharacterized protein n=1 Tax=Ligilactobacillus ubinensis TaxID=2876789 RepID=A0A9X2FMZ7_9LACO|nr:hypothetical protein [Ligilactobacillus ubinensis]MCP0888025.1 hypothetical protein [Ligilactobacillus ubinensis]
MSGFEIILPNEQLLSIDVTNKEYYNYDFQSFSLVPLQQSASVLVSDNIKQKLFSHISEAKLIRQLANKGEKEYVAKFTEYAKEKLESGEWQLGIKRDTGENYAVLRDAATKKFKSNVILESKVIRDLGNLPELSAIQGQLANISEQIEHLNKVIGRVEQGQYNDRYAGFFSARQLVIEGLATINTNLRQELLVSAIRTNNDTIGKLMLVLNQDINDFLNLKTKKKDAKRIDGFLQNSIGYLNSSVQLNLVAYTALGEQKPLLASLVNYQSFIEQILLKKIDDSDRTVAWGIDNIHVGTDGKFSELSTDISSKITTLLEGIETGKIGDVENEKIETTDM